MNDRISMKIILDNLQAKLRKLSPIISDLESRAYWSGDDNESSQKLHKGYMLIQEGINDFIKAMEVKG